MEIYQQSNGTYTTTPIYIGGVKCNTCNHRWVDQGATIPLNEKVVLQAQRCTLCEGAMRSLLVGEPSDVLEIVKGPN